MKPGHVYIKVEKHDNAEQTHWINRGNGWEIAGFGWVVPRHRR